MNRPVTPTHNLGGNSHRLTLDVDQPDSLPTVLGQFLQSGLDRGDGFGPGHEPARCPTRTGQHVQEGNGGIVGASWSARDGTPATAALRGTMSFDGVSQSADGDRVHPAFERTGAAKLETADPAEDLDVSILDQVINIDHTAQIARYAP
jgi:hypothetical protein